MKLATPAPPRIVAIAGNLHRPSRSRALAQAMLDSVARRVEATTEIYDLIDAGPGLGAAFNRGELSQDALRVIEAIEGADALVAVSPVYKGSYTGLFKHLIDFLPPAALQGRPVLIGATGGGHRHALVVEHQFRPLFGFFSALVVPTAVYASDGEFADGAPADPALLARLDLAASELAALLPLARQAPARQAGTTATAA